jgi:hypothetical protein
MHFYIVNSVNGPLEINDLYVCWRVTVFVWQELDLPQVDHGGGRARGRERATRATKSRVVDLCPLQEFKSH